MISAVSEADHPKYKDRLITDVVMLNTEKDSHYPEYVDIAKGGVTRRYYPVLTADKGANGSTKHDLNDKAGYPYLWMYYTTDYRDGWVLANKNDGSGELWKTWVETSTFNVNTHNIQNASGYYMHAYKKNAAGEWISYDIADMNEGVKGAFLYLCLGFQQVQ